MNFEKYASEAVALYKSASPDFYSERTFGQQFPLTMDKDDIAREMEYLSSPEGQERWRKANSIKSGIRLGVNALLGGAAGVSYAASRNKGLGAAVGLGLLGAGAATGINYAAQKAVEKYVGTGTEPRERLLQGRLNSLNG